MTEEITFPRRKFLQLSAKLALGLAGILGLGGLVRYFSHEPAGKLPPVMIWDWQRIFLPAVSSSGLIFPPSYIKRKMDSRLTAWSAPTWAALWKKMERNSAAPAMDLNSIRRVEF